MKQKTYRLELTLEELKLAKRVFEYALNRAPVQMFTDLPKTRLGKKLNETFDRATTQEKV